MRNLLIVLLTEYFECIPGDLKLAVDGRSRDGQQRLGKLNDGRWHRIDIIQTGKVSRI